MSHEVSNDELDEWEALAGAATPGPWFERRLDDSYAASLVAVSTAPGSGANERWPDFASGELVAGTLVQFPERYVDVADDRWDENARFIAVSREAVPRLIAEVRRLRAAQKTVEQRHRFGTSTSRMRLSATEAQRATAVAAKPSDWIRHRCRDGYDRCTLMPLSIRLWLSRVGHVAPMRQGHVSSWCL